MYIDKSNETAHNGVIVNVCLIYLSSSDENMSRKRTRRTGGTISITRLISNFVQ